MLAVDSACKVELSFGRKEQDKCVYIFSFRNNDHVAGPLCQLGHFLDDSSNLHEVELCFHLAL